MFQRTSLLKYRAEIDGLRAFAVLSVVVFHGFPTLLTGGFVGVDVFFVISGYLISRIIFEGLDKGTFSFADFYGRRVRRIFPALFVVMAASLVFGWFALLEDEYAQLGKHVLGGATFLSNFILWKEVGYFDNAADTKPLLHLWSLAVEEQFYIIWPVTLWFAWKRRFNLLWLTLIVASVSMGLNLRFVHTDPVETFFWPIGRFWELLCGSVLSWLTLYKQDALLSAKIGCDRFFRKVFRLEAGKVDGVIADHILGLLGLLVLAYGVTRIHEGLAFPGIWAVIPVVGAMLVIVAGPKAWTNRVFLMNPVAVWFGLISYPLYLWHWPILSFLRIVEADTPDAGMRFVAVVAAILLAWLTYRLIERPVRFTKTFRSMTTVMLCGFIALLGGGGAFVQSNGGFADRVAISEIQLQAKDLKFRIAKKDGDICDRLGAGLRCYYENENVTAVMIGDSHAPRIYWGLKDIYAQNGKNLAVIGGGAGCPPLLDVVSKVNSGDDTRQCIEKTTDSLIRVLQDDEIQEVVFASRGPLYTTSRGYGEYGAERFGDWVLHFEGEEQGQRSNQEVFEIALGRTFDAVLKAGKSATFLYDVPELGFDIKSCAFSRPFSWTDSTRKPCALDRKAYDERNREFNEMVERVLANYPSVRTVNLAEALCDKDLCYGAKGDVLFYTDGHHLSHRGAIYVAERLATHFD